MAATVEAEYVFGAEDLESRAKVVKFAVIQGNEREGAAQEHQEAVQRPGAPGHAAGDVAAASLGDPVAGLLGLERVAAVDELVAVQAGRAVGDR